MQKHIIRIPSNVSLLYSKKSKILVLKGPLGKKSLKLKTQINIIDKIQIIKVTSKPFQNVSKNDLKKLKIMQYTIASLIKHAILSVSIFIYKKLNLIGLTYRVFLLKNFNNKLLQFKLGYSHNIYFQVPKNFTVFCLKFKKIFLKGESYSSVFQTAALIRSYKKPEPYKGKGILYENEKIKLKKGKRI